MNRTVRSTGISTVVETLSRFRGGYRNSIAKHDKTSSQVFWVSWLLCLWVLSPINSNADLIRLNTTQTISPLVWDEVMSLRFSQADQVVGGGGPVGPSTPLVGEIELPQFRSSLGTLQKTSFALRLVLSREHFTEVRGCTFGNWEPPSPYSVIFNEIAFRDEGFNWILPYPTSGTGFPLMFNEPLTVDEVPGGFTQGDVPTLGFRRLVCPEFVEGPSGPVPYDWCVSEKHSPNITIQSDEYVIAGPSPRYQGLGNLTVPFEAKLRTIWAFIRDSTEPCDADATLEGHAQIGGQAIFQGYYLFTPAVDVFVSNHSTTKNILRFRYDEGDFIRQEFIPAGEGGVQDPQGLLFTPEGDLLVASARPPFSLEPPAILRFDGQTGAFQGEFADLSGQCNPTNMIYGPNGDLFVACGGSPGSVLRVDTETGQISEFSTGPCTSPTNCVLDGAWDLAFGPFGDLYVTAGTAGLVVRFDGTTGEYIDNFISDVPGVLDIVWRENSAELFLLIGANVDEYRIDPVTRGAVLQGTRISNAGPGAVAAGPAMRLGDSISTIPSLFSASTRGVFFHSPPTPYTENVVFNRGIGSARGLVVRPHVLQTISRDIQVGDSEVDYASAGLGVSVEFSEISAAGSLSLDVSTQAPGPDATGFEFLNTYYEFTVHEGLSYTGDVEICILVPSDTDANTAEIMRWNGTNWEPAITSSVIGNTVCATFPSLSWFGIALPLPVPGDIDGDGDVDRADISIILAARNTPASGPDDPRDLDGDGTITVLDARKCVLLCTCPRCVCP